MSGSAQKPLRVQKVEKELHQCIGQALTELLFIDQGVLVTVVEVDVAADMRSARVFVSVFPDHFQEEVFYELEAIRVDVQKLISKKIRMKFLPKLSWHKDKSVNEIDRIGKILADSKRQLANEENADEFVDEEE
jgi:ribosome-binding factor A